MTLCGPTDHEFLDEPPADFKSFGLLLMLGHFAQSCVFICICLICTWLTETSHQTLKCSATRRCLLLWIYVMIVEVLNNVIQVLRETAGCVYLSSILFNFQSLDMWVKPLGSNISQVLCVDGFVAWTNY